MVFFFIVLFVFAYNPLKIVSEYFSPTIIELNHKDSEETVVKAFKRIRPNGTIRLKSGTYYLTKDIFIKKPLKLVGVSGSVSITTNHKSLIFRAEGDSQVQNISFQNTAIRVEKGAVAISRCNFTAGGANYSAIKATKTASVRVEECVIRGYLRGIFADRDAVLKAYNNICESHKQSGIFLFGSAQGEVSGNTCQNNGVDGIAADEYSNLYAYNNTCKGNKQCGIALLGNAEGQVDSNACRNNGYHGIYADKQSRLVAKNNTCEGNKQVGIALFGSAQGEVSGNACRNNGYHGIYAQDQSRLVAKNNTCEGNIRSGFFLYGSAQGEVSGNTCRNNGLHGIAANDRSRLVARNNTCEGNGNCGVLLDDRASGRVENNTCSHNEFGIYKERTARAYVGYNECYSNSEGNLLLNQ